MENTKGGHHHKWILLKVDTATNRYYYERDTVTNRYYKERTPSCRKSDVKELGI